MKFTKAKAIAAALGQVVTLVGVVLADSVLDVSEQGQLIAAVIGLGATVYAVYKTENKPVPA